MHKCFLDYTKCSVPIIALLPKHWDAWLAKQEAAAKQWLRTINFLGTKAGSVALIPRCDGQLKQAIIVLNDEADFWSFGTLPDILPAGHYHYAEPQSINLLHRAVMAWGLGAYEFTKYKASTKPLAQLLLPAEIDADVLEAKLTAVYRVRDLINTPTEAMGPAELAHAVLQVGKKFHATVTEIIGDALLLKNYPAIHAVGRASLRAPRLIDLTWGSITAPKVTVVGKGICFDAGGLNIKSGASMLLMKKDMGGAAQALGLAEMIMAMNLPVRLRLLIPAAENLIAGNAYKPGDIITMRNGLSVEVDCTDAEGRLVLADALTEADSENPALLIVFSTLTGAARVAVGTEISAFFTAQETLAQDLLVCSDEEQDPMWRLPLYKPYQKILDSKLADMCNSGSSPYAGAITAALFLRAFVQESTVWVHIDSNAYNVNYRPGRPEGGEAMAVLAVLHYLMKKYTTH